MALQLTDRMDVSCFSLSDNFPSAWNLSSTDTELSLPSISGIGMTLSDALSFALSKRRN
jgi:hypothetical protein